MKYSPFPEYKQELFVVRLLKFHMPFLKLLFEISYSILVLTPPIWAGYCCIPLLLSNSKYKNWRNLNLAILGARNFENNTTTENFFQEGIIPTV
jgi:hypothetical protein